MFIDTRDCGNVRIPGQVFNLYMIIYSKFLIFFSIYLIYCYDLSHNSSYRQIHREVSQYPAWPCRFCCTLDDNIFLPISRRFFLSCSYLNPNKLSKITFLKKNRSFFDFTRVLYWNLWSTTILCNHKEKHYNDSYFFISFV